MESGTGGVGRRDMLKTGALGVGALAGMSAVAASSAASASAAEGDFSVAAATDFFLKIEGVEGESTDAKHPGTIEIESFSWGVSNAGTTATTAGGAGGGAGKVVFQDIHFTTRVNKASPILMFGCATGEHFKKATLFVRKAGTEQQDYYKVTLEDCLVSSYQSGGSSGADALPIDQFSLNFFRITFSYTPQNADGSLGTPVERTYPPR